MRRRGLDAYRLRGKEEGDEEGSRMRKRKEGRQAGGRAGGNKRKKTNKNGKTYLFPFPIVEGGGRERKERKGTRIYEEHPSPACSGPGCSSPTLYISSI